MGQFYLATRIGERCGLAYGRHGALFPPTIPRALLIIIAFFGMVSLGDLSGRFGLKRIIIAWPEYFACFRTAAADLCAVIPAAPGLVSNAG